MKRVRIDMRELDAAGAPGIFGTQLEAPLPTAMPSYSAAASSGVKPRRSWLSRIGSVVRNAAIAVVLMALLPTALAVVQGDHLARVLFDSGSNTRARIENVQAVRPFGVDANPSITPMQAGLALNALQQDPKVVPGFPVIEPASRPAASWRTEKMSPDMFVSARTWTYDGPSSEAILEAAAKGFSPRELEYLRKLAESPLWRDFDLVARAPAVDIIGGHLKIPFGPDARAEQRPLLRFKDTKEVAYAAVSRAAWYMARGQRDSAETVLRSIVSFGFALVDNGTTTLDELIGTVIVGIGRDALQRFYVIEHDSRATMVALAPPTRSVRSASPQATVRLSTGEARRRLLARVEDPAVPLGERFDGLRSLSLASCTNARELLFGPRADVTDVLARARQRLARYPSEQALVDLQSRMLVVPPDFRATNPVQSLVVSAGTISGAVLHNPRLASCAVVLTSGW